MTTTTSPSPTADAISAGLVTAVDHVGLAVPDLEAAVEWYSVHFGMVSTHEEVNEGQGVREAMLSVPGATGQSAQIQLLCPLDENSTIKKFLDRNGPGMQQLAFRVTDLDAASDFFRARGVRLLFEAPRRGTADARINFLHPKDAGGVLIELIEPPKKV